MRTVVTVFAILALASASLLVDVRDREPGFGMPPLPENLLAWILINDPAHSLELLSRVQLDNLEVDLGKVMPAQPLVLQRLQELARLDQPRFWVLVHGLEDRDSGSRKLHLTLVLSRGQGMDRQLDEAIEALAEALFSGPAQMVEDGEVRLLRGPARRQLIYQVRLPDAVLVSNSHEGWRHVLAAWAGTFPLMRETPAFAQLRGHFDLSEGVLVYCDSSQILPFLPEFGYQVRRTLLGVEDEFYPLKSNTEVDLGGTSG